MYKRLIIFAFALSVICQARAQETTTSRVTPSFALKTNVLYDATASMNLGVEFKIGPRLTLEAVGTYNPWTFSNEKKWKHILAQPELRFWFCEPFNGHFLGLHAHYAMFNVNGVKIPQIIGTGISADTDKYRYEGWLAGGGISYGYQFYLGRRWNLETTLGVGYAYIDYEKFQCGKCGTFESEDTKHYFGLTKAGISLIYLIK